MRPPHSVITVLTSASEPCDGDDVLGHHRHKGLLYPLASQPVGTSELVTSTPDEQASGLRPKTSSSTSKGIPVSTQFTNLRIRAGDGSLALVQFIAGESVFARSM